MDPEFKQWLAEMIRALGLGLVYAFGGTVGVVLAIEVLKRIEGR
jgi:hypothetical protein